MPGKRAAAIHWREIVETNTEVKFTLFVTIIVLLSPAAAVTFLTPSSAEIEYLIESRSVRVTLEQESKRSAGVKEPGLES